MSSVMLSPRDARAGALRSHALEAPGHSVGDITARMVGLHATSPVSPFLSANARLVSFARRDLSSPMWDSWELVRFRGMRNTMFVFTRHDLQVVAAATRDLKTRVRKPWFRDSGVTPDQFRRLASRVDAVLDGCPMTTRELRLHLAVSQDVDLAGVVARMCDEGHLVGGAPPRHWTSSIRRYHRWQDVLPDVDLGAWDPTAAVVELIRRYLASYGPVTVADIAWWTGFSKTVCRSALEALSPEVETVIVDGWPGPLFRMHGSVDKQPDGDTIAVLPLLDPYVQGYRDRERLLDSHRHRYVYDAGGNAAATILHAGEVVGVWQLCRSPDAVRYHLFWDASKRLRVETEESLAKAGRVVFDRDVDVVARARMKPLDDGGGRSAAHPLDSQIHRASRRTQ